MGTDGFSFSSSFILSRLDIFFYFKNLLGLSLFLVYKIFYRDGWMVEVDGGGWWWMVDGGGWWMVDGRKKSSPISLKIGTLVLQNNYLCEIFVLCKMNPDEN